MPRKDPEERKAYDRAYRKKHKKTQSETPPANKAYTVGIPVLPQPKPGTEALSKVNFNMALLYATQEASPESVGIARAWLEQFFRYGEGWPGGKIAVFFISREDAGGFPREELPELYEAFTRYYLRVTSREIPRGDQRKQPEQAENFRGKNTDSRDAPGRAGDARA
jgi:hypothetical protein